MTKADNDKLFPPENVQLGCWYGDGWAELVRPAFEACRDYGIKVVQVKEKFGTLRFYTEKSHPVVDEIIQLAERRSEVTCEKCGMPGRLRAGGWLRTLCDQCHAGRRLTRAGE